MANKFNNDSIFNGTATFNNTISLSDISANTVTANIVTANTISYSYPSVPPSLGTSNIGYVITTNNLLFSGTLTDNTTQYAADVYVLYNINPGIYILSFAIGIDELTNYCFATIYLTNTTSPYTALGPQICAAAPLNYNGNQTITCTFFVTIQYNSNIYCNLSVLGTGGSVNSLDQGQLQLIRIA